VLSYLIRVLIHVFDGRWSKEFFEITPRIGRADLFIELTEMNMKGHEMFLMELKKISPFLDKDSIKSHHIRFIKSKLNSIPLFSSLIYKLRIPGFQRVTINKRLFGGKGERISKVGLLKYPPPIYITRFGRMNFPHQSVLYATFDPITALSEMRPEPGDRITISTWGLTSNYDLTISPVFKNTSKDGKTHSETSLRALLEYEKQFALHDDETSKQIDIVNSCHVHPVFLDAHPPLGRGNKVRA
jgi:hypothetical protein